LSWGDIVAVSINPPKIRFAATHGQFVGHTLCAEFRETSSVFQRHEERRREFEQLCRRPELQGGLVLADEKSEMLAVVVVGHVLQGMQKFGLFEKSAGSVDQSCINAMRRKYGIDVHSQTIGRLSTAHQNFRYYERGAVGYLRSGHLGSSNTPI
jgi:hypothetical protein